MSAISQVPPRRGHLGAGSTVAEPPASKNGKAFETGAVTTPRPTPPGSSPPTPGGATPGPVSPPVTPKPTYFWVFTTDQRGNKTNVAPDLATAATTQDPAAESARFIAFHLRRDATEAPPKDQLELIGEAERLLHALNHLYAPGDLSSEAKFRRFYVYIFRTAALVLQDGKLDAATGKAEMIRFGKELIGDEGTRIKNAHIAELVRSAALLAVPFLVAYTVLSAIATNPRGSSYAFLQKLHIEPTTAAWFMLLWVGAFLGVCISYTARKRSFTVDDLVAASEDDLLRPLVRLAFAGVLTMVVVMFSQLTILELGVGPLKLSSAVGPLGYLYAFPIGIVCGISEMLLPSGVTGQKPLLTGSVPP